MAIASIILRGVKRQVNKLRDEWFHYELMKSIEINCQRMELKNVFFNLEVGIFLSTNNARKGKREKNGKCLQRKTLNEIYQIIATEGSKGN